MLEHNIISGGCEGQLFCSNSFEVIKKFNDNSIDCVITDPP